MMSKGRRRKGKKRVRHGRPATKNGHVALPAAQSGYTLPVGAVVEVRKAGTVAWVEHRMRTELRFDEYRLTDLGYGWMVEHLDYLIRAEKGVWLAPRKPAKPQGEYVELDDCTILRKTDKALLVHHDEVSRWFPLSQLKEPDELFVDDEGVSVFVTEWFAKQTGIA